MSRKICIVGGGAAGMMAAGKALEYTADVTVFEHMSHLGKKLAITGKGRCNITNLVPVEEFMENITKNPRFMYSALNAFDPYMTVSFFEDLGVKTKLERGNRIFPESDKAREVVDALRKYSSRAKKIFEKVVSIDKNTDGSFTVNNNINYRFDRVIIATGGRSYPATGSDGSGFKLAKSFGHTVTPLIPSLIPICSSSSICERLQGLSLKNVGIKIKDSSGKELYSDFGEMLFTHFGVSGPIILSASAHLRNIDISSLTLYIDLKPALDEKTLDQRLLYEFSEKANRDVINTFGDLLPTKLIEPFIDYLKIDKRKKVHLITKQERKAILSALKGFAIPLLRFRPIDEAIVTSGGVDVKSVNPKTMESKIIKGLYFAGECLDVDAYTGGFNLQIAFSTAFLAAKSAAE